MCNLPQAVLENAFSIFHHLSWTNFCTEIWSASLSYKPLQSSQISLIKFWLVYSFIIEQNHLSILASIICISCFCVSHHNTGKKSPKFSKWNCKMKLLLESKDYPQIICVHFNRTAQSHGQQPAHRLQDSSSNPQPAPSGLLFIGVRQRPQAWWIILTGTTQRWLPAWGQFRRGQMPSVQCAGTLTALYVYTVSGNRASLCQDTAFLHADQGTGGDAAHPSVEADTQTTDLHSQVVMQIKTCFW